MFDFAAFIGYFDNGFMLGGAAVTVGLTLASLAGGLLLGMALAVLRSGGGVGGRVAGVYVWVFRGTPLLVQLVIIYTGLPQLGFKFGVVVSALLALTLNEAAYLSEIIRAGFAGVAAGQGDAARALGLGRVQTVWLVTLPQAFRIIIPPLGNSVNGLLKATSITSVISMEELMRRSQMIMQLKFDVLEVYCVAAVYYLALTTLWDFVQRALERRFGRGYAPVAAVPQGARA
ncbi:MAG: amino acid ABC transporter permease [Janthinobacterium lividum]